MAEGSEMKLDHTREDSFPDFREHEVEPSFCAVLQWCSCASFAGGDSYLDITYV